MSRLRKAWLYLTAPLLLLAACTVPTGVSFTLDFGSDSVAVGRGGTVALTYRANGASVQTIRYRFAHQAASTTVALASNAGSISIVVPNDTPLGASMLSASLISEGVAVRTADVTVTVVDEGAPSVSWVAPAWGSRLSGTVTLQAAATDDTGIARVEFLINGQVIGSSPSGSVSVDTRNLPNGTVIITARAIDLSGKTATADRTFQIGNAGTNVPAIQWALPYSYQSFVPGEEIEFAVEVSDTSGELSSVKFFVGQDLVHTVTNLTDVASEREVSFTFGGFDTVVGPVVLRAEATNAFGGMSSALRNIVIVSPEAPVVDRTRPLVWWDRDYVWNGKVVERTIQLGIIAQDDVEVDYFDWTLNGTAFVERVQIDRDDTRNPPFYKVWNWNTATVPDGSYTLEVVAVDTSGNRSETVRVSLVVRNASQPVAPDNERPVAWFDEDCVWNNMVVQDDDVPMCVVGDDNVRVDYFDVFLNGSWVREVNATRYEDQENGPRYDGNWLWDTLDYPDGTYQWAVEAVDSSGNRSQRSTVTVRVDNGPTIAWDAYYAWNGKIVSGNDYTFRVEHNNDRDFSYLDVYINGAWFGTYSEAPDDVSAWTFEWDTLEWPDGTYTVTAIARDLSGNSSPPISVTVHVHNALEVEWTTYGVATGGYVYVITDISGPFPFYVVSLGANVLVHKDIDQGDIYLDLYVNGLHEAKICFDQGFMTPGCDYEVEGYTVLHDATTEDSEWELLFANFYWIVESYDLAGAYELTIRATESEYGKTSEPDTMNVIVDSLRYQFRTTIDGWTNAPSILDTTGPLEDFSIDTSPVDIIVTLEGNLPSEAVCRMQLMFGGEGNMAPIDTFWDYYEDADLDDFIDWMLTGGTETFDYGGGWHTNAELFEFQYVGNNQWRLTWDPYIPLAYDWELVHYNQDQVGAEYWHDSDWDSFDGVYHVPMEASYNGNGWGKTEGEGDSPPSWDDDLTGEADYWSYRSSYSNLSDRYIGARIELCGPFGNENAPGADGNRWHQATRVVIPYRGSDDYDRNKARYTLTLP